MQRTKCTRLQARAAMPRRTVWFRNYRGISSTIAARKSEEGRTMQLRMRCLALLALAAISAVAQAQSWPSKPVRIVVPSTTGGALDIFSRLFGGAFEKQLGQPFVTDNRPGALSQIGTEAV